MFVMKSKLLTIAVLAAVTFCSVPQSRADDNSLEAVADITLVRPGCFLATAIGSVFFVVSLPVTAASGSIKKTADTLVVHPAQATFTRPVGDFSTLP